MAADSNMRFHQGIVSPLYSSHLVSFQSGTSRSTTEMVPKGMNSSEMILAGNSSMIGNAAPMVVSQSSSGNVLRDPTPSLKHDTGLAVEWSLEEQAILKEGLVKYAKEPKIMKYIKIAADLRDKTVRDVALRCRWMRKEESGKRRKLEESYLGKKIKDRKEKWIDSSLKANISPVQQCNLPLHSQLMHQMNHNQFLYKVPMIDAATRNLLDENTQVLSQITANLAAFKLQDNVNLFYSMRNNIGAILASMNEMPGIASHMPPLPVSINEELVNVILPAATQAPLFGAPVFST